MPGLDLDRRTAPGQNGHSGQCVDTPRQGHCTCGAHAPEAGHHPVLPCPPIALSTTTLRLDQILMEAVKRRSTEALETDGSHILDNFGSTYRMNF